MDPIGKPNLYEIYTGVNAGADIDFASLQMQGGDYNWYYGSSSQHPDHDQLIQTDLTKPNGNQHAGKSSGEFQLQTTVRSSNSKVPAPEKQAKKRQIDKNYRERCKRNTMQMGEALKRLDEENKQLRMENKSLKEKSCSTAEMLQSQAKQLKELKLVIDKLNSENQKQNALVQTLSQHLVDYNLSQENQKLKDENCSLRKIVGLTDGPLKLAEENGKLQRENVSLKVQIDALCGKIIHDDRRKE